MASAENELETDAAPLPPRNKPASPKPKVEEPKHETHSNVSKQTSSIVHGNSITVIKSTNVHVGSNFYHSPGGKFSDRFKSFQKEEDIPLTKPIAQLFNNDERLNRDHFELISEHVGEAWQSLGTKLGFSSGQIQQFQINHSKYKIQEVIYQMLLEWSQRQPENATVSYIMDILWNSNMKFIVKIFSEYDFNLYNSNT